VGAQNLALIEKPAALSLGHRSERGVSEEEEEVKPH